jgi:hypothetical protein
MEEKFKIKTYGYCELAQLYFPNISKKSASVQLRTWIKLNEKLKNELYKAGFIPGKKILTPRQVILIINEIGEP